jgi:hypothetical protein
MDPRVDLVFNKVESRTGIDIRCYDAEVCLEQVINATQQTGNEYAAVISADGVCRWITAYDPDWTYVPRLPDGSDRFVCIHTHPYTPGDTDVFPSLTDMCNFLTKPCEVDVIFGKTDVFLAYKTSLTPALYDLDQDTIAEASLRADVDFWAARKYLRKHKCTFTEYLKLALRSDTRLLMSLYGIEYERIDCNVY